MSVLLYLFLRPKWIIPARSINYYLSFIFRFLYFLHFCRVLFSCPPVYLVAGGGGGGGGGVRGILTTSLPLWGRRLEDWPNAADRLVGRRRVTKQGVILYAMDGPCRLPCRTTPLVPVWDWSVIERIVQCTLHTQHRHDLSHARKAWPGTLVDPCLLFVLPMQMWRVAFFLTSLTVVYSTPSTL